MAEHHEHHGGHGGSCSCGQGSEAAVREEDQSEMALRRALDRIQRKLLVMSGKGGVGKSSVAVTLALTLARQGKQVGLLDIDLHGPNVLRMLGLTKPLNVAEMELFAVPAGLENLKVVSIEAFLPDRESAIIWRGPLKHQTIRQFISDVQWGDLDYLVIDAPPGTGDEPLSVVQTIPEAQAVIVTTPQEISLADVRKSIDFCHKTNLAIAGLVENMSRLVCPECGKEIPLFRAGGGQRLASQAQIAFLGSLPFDPRVVEEADQGRLGQLDTADSPFLKVMAEVTAALRAGEAAIKA